ncbi:MAG: hypothetical protein ACREDV_06575 [Methylocella sp.]
MTLITEFGFGHGTFLYLGAEACRCRSRRRETFAVRLVLQDASVNCKLNTKIRAGILAGPLGAG